MISQWLSVKDWEGKPLLGKYKSANLTLNTALLPTKLVHNSV